MKLRTVLSLLIVASLLLEMAAADAADPPRPHMVVFMADDLGWKDVGYHGSEIKTPHIDSLAESGVRLDHFYVQPVCSPTRSSLLTGRYPIRLGLQVGVVRPWANYGLPLEERTLAQALDDVGYRTAIMGKWHLGHHEPDYLPLRRGFDHQYGHYNGALDYFTHRRDGGLDWHRDDKALEEEGYTTLLIGREASRLIREHDSREPLFLYVPFNAPHSPLQAPDEYLDQYQSIEDRKRRTYAAMVTCVDDAIGQIMQALREQNMEQNTLVLFTSDNGGPEDLGANNGPLRNGKGSVYEGGIRVPAFACWPGKLPPRQVVTAPLHIVDWYPTLLNLAGAEHDKGAPLDGKDAWQTIAAGAPSPHDEILHNVTPTDGALRKGHWKIIWHLRNGSETIELFNIAKDPYEEQDLSQQHPEKVQELRERLQFYADAAVAPKGGQGRMPRNFKIPAVWGEG